MHTSRSLFVLVGTTALLFAFSANAKTPSKSMAHESLRALSPMALYQYNRGLGGDPRPGQLMVSLTPGATRAELQADASLRGCTISRQMGNRALFVLACAPNRSIDDEMNGWRTAKSVAFYEAAFPNRRPLGEDDEAESFVPNDLFEDAWHHQNTGQTIQKIRGTPGADIGSPQAWAVTTGSPDVIIAVIDSGITFSHEDLKGRLWKNTAEACTGGVDDDGNGYIDDCNGWDTGDNDSLPSPDSLPKENEEGDPCAPNHGPFIAGLIAATGDNDQGIAGVGWGLKVMNLKSHPDKTCKGNVMTSTEAALYAIDNGAHILSMSFESAYFSKLFEQTLREAEARGILVVISAGNNGNNIDAPWEAEQYPAQYDLVHALVVANTTHTDELFSASSWGYFSVDIAAPGTHLPSINHIKPHAYTLGTGTSYSSPLVAAAGGLLWSAYPELSLGDVSSALIEGGTYLPDMDCERDVSPCIRTGRRLYIPGALDVAAERVVQLEYESHLLDDAGTGNGNGVLDSGENAALTVTLARQGPRVPGSLIGMLTGSGDELDAVRVTGHEVALIATDDDAVTFQTQASFGLQGGECDKAHTDGLTLTVTEDNGAHWTFEIPIDQSCIVDGDGDGVAQEDDCDDAEAATFEGNPEICDHIDNDCDGSVDNDATDTPTWYADRDQDGAGDPNDSVETCFPPEEGDWVEVPYDCNDDDPDIQLCPPAPPEEGCHTTKTLPLAGVSILLCALLLAWRVSRRPRAQGRP